MKIKQQGFTLIELMIVIVTIALLATIAYPSYAKYIRQTRLAAVRSELLQNARTLERYYTQKRTFKDFSNDSLVQNEYFDISLTRNDAAGFELKAEPNAGAAVGASGCPGHPALPAFRRPAAYQGRAARQPRRARRQRANRHRRKNAGLGFGTGRIRGRNGRRAAAGCGAYRARRQHGVSG